MDCTVGCRPLLRSKFCRSRPSPPFAAVAFAAVVLRSPSQPSPSATTTLHRRHPSPAVAFCCYRAAPPPHFAVLALRVPRVSLALALRRRRPSPPLPVAASPFTIFCRRLLLLPRFAILALRRPRASPVVTFRPPSPLPAVFGCRSPSPLLLLSSVATVALHPPSPVAAVAFHCFLPSSPFAANAPSPTLGSQRDLRRLIYRKVYLLVAVGLPGLHKRSHRAVWCVWAGC